MVHTGSVAKVQGEGKQWLTKHGNLPEGFSICPVHTGMNLTASELQEMLRHLPRTHGDESFPDGFVVGVDAFEPRVHGNEPYHYITGLGTQRSAPYIRR